MITYNIVISYYTLDVTHYSLTSSKINDTIHIVMIADVHDFHCKIKNKTIAKIKELQPIDQLMIMPRLNICRH